MKKVLPMLLLLMITAACSGPSYMAWKPEKHDIRAIKPLPGKAALVVARTTSAGSNVEFETFLDRSMIGLTKGPGYFIKRNIEPGPHYIITRADFAETSDTVSGMKTVDTSRTAGNTKNVDAPTDVETLKIIETAKIIRVDQISFEPDTVYYTLQTPRIEKRITVAPVTPDYLVREMDSDCALLDYEEINPVADLSDTEYREFITGYEREVIEGLHKEYLIYKGVKILNNQPASDKPEPKK